MKLLHVVGTRPNFVKAMPVIRALTAQASDCEQIVIHTGQHYDPNMSQTFFDDFDLPCTIENLNVGSGSHAAQTGNIMRRFEPALLKYAPRAVVVYGDVNSTLAAAIVAAKCGTPVIHVEAGLRSGDRTMPEEINRILTDQIAEQLFAPSRDAVANLAAEGISGDNVHFVGNVMIDTLVNFLPRCNSDEVLRKLDIEADRYVMATIHRPSNVDSEEKLTNIVHALAEISRELVVIFPVHPRTVPKLAPLERVINASGIRLVDPLGYTDFISLQRAARLVITDSGGVQEETTYMCIPCLTVRPNTERPVTVSHGTNRLVAPTRDSILSEYKLALETSTARCNIELWDGRAARRIADIVAAEYGNAR